MTIESMFNVIRDKFELLDLNGAKKQFDNAPVEDPDPDGGPSPEDKEPWVRFSIKPGQSFQVSKGATKRFRQHGLAIAQVFVGIEEGDQAGLAIADIIQTDFRAVTANGITWKSPYPNVIGASRKGRWWQINVICPFYSDTIA